VCAFVNCEWTVQILWRQHFLMFGEDVYCICLICFYPVFLYILATNILLSLSLLKIGFFSVSVSLFSTFYWVTYQHFRFLWMPLRSHFWYRGRLLWRPSCYFMFQFLILFSLLKSVDGNLRSQRLGNVCVWCMVFLLQTTNCHRLRRIRMVPFNSIVSIAVSDFSRNKFTVFVHRQSWTSDRLCFSAWSVRTLKDYFVMSWAKNYGSIINLVTNLALGYSCHSFAQEVTIYVYLFSLLMISVNCVRTAVWSLVLNY